MKYPDDARYLVLDFGYFAPTAFAEHLYNSNGEYIAGYTEGEDEAMLFTINHLDKHKCAPSGDMLVLDILTGQIVNWKPLEEKEVDDFLAEMSVIAQEAEWYE